jgi:hypothetical protein
VITASTRRWALLCLHQIAALVARGCLPALALEMAR